MSNNPPTDWQHPDAGDADGDGDGRIDGAPDSYIEAGARGAAYLLLGADLGFPAL